MGVFNDIFAKSRDRPKTKIPTGRVTSPGTKRARLSPSRSITSDVLETLRKQKDQISAIEYLKKVNPDVSMAVWNFVRLANQGNKMSFYTIDGEHKIPGIEEDWRKFAARINEISNSGLDGLIDQLHHSAFMQGAMGVEVEVEETRTNIYDVFPVKPKTIYWALEERNGRETWIPYQQQWLKNQSLEQGIANFFWVPTDPEINDPRGSLILSPVLQAIDFQMQILQDLQAVLHHQGYPKNDIKIILERMLSAAPSMIKNNPQKLSDWLNDQWNNIRSMFQKIEPDDDYLHFDDVEINTNQGANTSRSLDVRAIDEMLSVQTLSGTKQMAIFMNRNQGITESWGTVQFRIFCSGIASIQRGSKRLVEEVARLWLRVNGIQAIPVFEHNLIDWNSEEQRMTVNILKEKFYAISQMMGWIDADTAASEVCGVDKAVSTPNENIRVSLGVTGGDEGVRNNDDKRKQKQDPDDKKFRVLR
jgi:hypothetical protein